MSTDIRGWHVALVPDALLNPAPSEQLPDVMQCLESAGYGVLQLPAAAEHRLLLTVTADQIAEYAHHGYAVMAVGLQRLPEAGLHWRRLAALLRGRNAALPPRHVIQSQVDVATETQRLRTFLAAYDLPLDEQRHWRV